MLLQKSGVGCSECGKEAVVFQRHTGRALCRECFINDVVSRVRNEVNRFSMFGAKDNVLVGVSGGKDSYVLVDVLFKIHDPGRMGFVLIEEGIPDYGRLEQAGWVKELAKDSGVDLYVISFKEYVGYSLKELVDLSRRRGLKVSPCTYCGITRRRIMNQLARELGFRRVLTAHTLDDEAQTVLMNILRGDLLRLVQGHPAGPLLSPLFVRRVKPLRKVYEVEVATYAYLKGFVFQERECPYIQEMPSLRAQLRKYLYRLEMEAPGSLLRFLERVDELVHGLIPKYSSLPELPRCVRCGEPTAYGRKYCKLCELLMELGINKVPGLREEFTLKHTQ